MLVSSPYSAERTGKGLRLDWTLQEQCEAPADRFPRVVEVVVRRAEKDLGEPEELVVEGDEKALLEAIGGYPRELLDAELPPLAEEALEEETDGDGPTEEPDPGADGLDTDLPLNQGSPVVASPAGNTP